MLRNFYFVAVLIYSTLSWAGKTEVTLEIYNVGQGNCSVLTVKQPKSDPEHMIIDIGSASYKNERLYIQNQSPMQLSPFEEGGSISRGIFGSTLKKTNIKELKEESPWEEEENKKDCSNEEFIMTLREKFKKPGQTMSKQKMKNPPGIYVKTVLLTHPDKDHYGWLLDLFSKKEDHIGYLIFGGLPEAYCHSNQLGFRKWIDMRLKNGTKVYFPAIRYKSITSLDDVMPHKDRTFEKQFYTKPEKERKRFKKALDFGPDVLISFLSINPTHFLGNGDKILRMTDSEDSNVDSLVLKIAYGNSSAILTGDATGVTTTRIINNYSTNADFLKTNVLLASHHGSGSHDPNNEEWIQITQPEFVLTSNGFSQGYPNETAYQNFKKSSRLKRVPRHKVLVATSKTEGCMHTTQNAIFSTLNSGTLTVQFEKEGSVQLQTAQTGKIEILSSQKKPKDKPEIITILETEGTIILSPMPKTRGNITGRELFPSEEGRHPKRKDSTFETPPPKHKKPSEM